MLLSAILIPAPEGGFIALNQETGTTSQGETVEAALTNLQEATEVYSEEFLLKTSGQPLVTTFQALKPNLSRNPDIGRKNCNCVLSGIDV